MRVYRPLAGPLTHSSVLAPALTLALLAGLGLLLAQSSAPKQDLSDFEKRLAKINGQISELRGKIEAEALKESSVLSNLARINLNKALVEREIAAWNVQMEKARAELNGIQGNVRDLKANLERDNAAIEKTLVTLYKFGRLNFFHFMLQARDFEAYTTESKRLTLLARYQEDTVAAYLKTLAEFGEAEGRLAAKKKDVAEILRETSLKKQELEAEQRKYSDLVQEIRRNRQTHEQAIRELRDSAEQLQVMMKKIADEQWALPSAFVPLYERRGKLPWPLEGRVITSFGLQRHPRFNTIVMNNGVEIAPAKDKSLILAVHAGKVAFADYFQGYGNLLILDHGMTYYTLYGHCSQFLVNVGDMVRADQPVALVGDSGSLNGECLYFEVRYKTKALDPLQWLKRR
ncbi:MAG: peptidoglycan DD-metalloendopeptidase family protein [Candidatus Aminicenantales bacterium]|jgi:septal ring factor EnvC (AmiA/AmiB activator)